MSSKAKTIFIIVTVAYLMMLLLTDISLVGYWTDIIFSIILVSIGLLAGYKPKSEKLWANNTLRALLVSSAILVVGVLGLTLINPFAWDMFKMRSFCYQDVDGRLFNAYFTPVGAYSGGEGVFWITETPTYFPIVEIEKHYDGAVLWDFAGTEWEGEPIDQQAVVESYIQLEVIENEHQE